MGKIVVSENVTLDGRSVVAQQPEDGGQVAHGAGPADLVSGLPE